MEDSTLINTVSGVSSDFGMFGCVISAAPLDMSKFLKDGEVDITNVPDNDVIDLLSHTDFMEIVKRGKGYTIPNWTVPVTVFRRIFSRRCRCAEAASRKFKNIDEIIEFLIINKGLLVYQIKYNKVFDQYVMRFFTSGDNLLKLNFINYLYNRLFVWKRW